MKYTLILTAKPGCEPEVGSQDWGPYSAEFGAWNEKAAEAGIHLGGEPVQPASTATTLRKKGDRVEPHDGPFAELKEGIIGWYLIDCDNLDVAIDWASKIPVVARGYGAVEIRPVVDFSSLAAE